MKAKIIRPYQRHLLALLPLLVISGCSGVQSGSLYQQWEQQAYNAYNVSAPVHKPGVLPALLRTVAVPGQRFMRHHPSQRVSYQSAAAGPVVNTGPDTRSPDRLSEQELNFIEQNYGI